MVLTNLGQIGMSTTDAVVMGWLGPKALAAGTLGLNLFLPLLIFAIGVMSAIAPMIAADLGRKTRSVHQARRTARQGFWLTAALSLLFLPVLWFAEPILLALGQEPALAADAALYLRAMMWSLPPQILYLALRSFVGALERPGAALVTVGAAFVVNAVLNVGLVFGRFGLPALGLPGSGVATSIASFFMALGLALLILRERRLRRFHVFGRFWRADPARLVELSRVGAPIGATMLLEAGVFNAAVFVMGRIGADALAAHAVAIQIASVTFMVAAGVGQAASVRVGRFFGARDGPGQRRAGKVALGLGVGFMAAAALVIALTPRTLAALFLDASSPRNAAALDLAASFLVVAAMFQVFDGAQAVGAGMLRGMQDTRAPMLIALFGYWVIGFPLALALAFPLGWGGLGVWTGLAIGLAFVAAAILMRWSRLSARA
jgi:MATE family multidrug resistance protein